MAPASSPYASSPFRYRIILRRHRQTVNDTDRVLSLAHADPSDPYAQADALRKAAADYQGDSGVLRAGLSGIEAEMRRRGVPGATSESVIEGTIREDMPRIIADDLMYR